MRVASAHARSKNYAYQNWKAHLSGALRPDCGLARLWGGYLRAGDTLTVRFGDRRQGSAGFRLQTNCEERVELKTSVDAFATYEFTELREQPGFALVAGPATHWKAIWPSLAMVGEPFRLAVLAEDIWGNPTTQAKESLTLVPSRPVRGLPERIAIKTGDGPRLLDNLVVDSAGDLELRIMADGAELARANPLRVVTAAPLRRYWGDLHGQSGETIGMGSAESYFRSCPFVCHSEQTSSPLHSCSRRTWTSFRH